MVILTVSHRTHFKCATLAIGLQSTPTSQKVGTVLAALPPPMELEFLGLLIAVLRIPTTVAATISALVLLRLLGLIIKISAGAADTGA